MNSPEQQLSASHLHIRRQTKADYHCTRRTSGITALMEDLVSPMPATEPQPKLIVTLKLPVVHAQEPVQTQISSRQTQTPRYPEQGVPDFDVLDTSPTKPGHVGVDSPQSLLVSFPLSPAARELQNALHKPPRPEVASAIEVGACAMARSDDARTTAGAPSQDLGLEPERYCDSHTTSDQELGKQDKDQMTSDQSVAKEPDAECIRVSKPRPADEDALQPDTEAEPLQQRHHTRVSISISDLLRPASEEPPAQDMASQPIAKDADVYPAAQATNILLIPQSPTSSSEAGTRHVSTIPTADVVPLSDALMQKPGPEMDTPVAAAAPAPAPQTPQTAKVTLRLSPTGMAKVSQLTKLHSSSKDCGRDRNPRRQATRAYGVVKTPERSTPKAKARKPRVVSEEAAVKANPRKRGAQGNAVPVTAKRPKLDSAAATTRSSRASSEEAPAARPEKLIEGPSFELDPLTREPRPIRDAKGDSMYVRQMIKVLEVQSKSRTNDTEKGQSVTMKALLERATYAREDDALFLTASEASKHLSPGRFWNNVMITAEQQPLPLQTVNQFLDEFYEEDVQVWIQDSSAKTSKQAPSIRQVSIKAVKERLTSGQTRHLKPWNLLELATHHEDGLRPRFLNNEDCRLLTKLKIPAAADHTRRKTYPVGFKEVEKWALLAQAGALTLPHQDSHGYSTYITLNVGLVGFGWLSSPTPEVRAEWNKKTQSFIEGTWRYVVLKPGQTVYFPAGTVHFVFRLPSAGNTLAFGGHVLRCSNIVHWVKCLLEEVQSASVTNEDLTDSATGYLERVEKFVTEARKRGDVERWGGEESITEFLKLKAKFMGWKKQVSR